jgi:hypothetical protein
MIDAERPSFGVAEVIEIASKFEAANDAFLIGGQATNFWAWFFQEDEPELKLKGPFTSQDIGRAARHRRTCDYPGVYRGRADRFPLSRSPTQGNGGKHRGPTGSPPLIKWLQDYR